MFRKTADLLYKYIIKTNIFISICAVSFYVCGVLILFPSDIVRFSEALPIVFLSTLLIYNVSQEKWNMSFIFHKPTRIIALLAFTLLPVVVLIRDFSLETILYLGHLGIIAIFYNSPLLNSVKHLPLRSIPMIKIFLIAYIWAGIGAVLPVLIHKSPLDTQVFLLFSGQLCFILAITLPFDIRDYYKDKEADLKTIPGAIGIKKTKYLAYFFSTLHFIVFAFVLNQVLIFIPLALLMFLLVRNASASKPDHYYTFYIDALIILQLLSVYLLRQI